MGLFTSKKITTVGTSVARVIEDKAIPNSVRTGLIKAIFQDGNIPDYINEEMVASIGVRAERMFEYGRDKYVFGNPGAGFHSATQGRELVESLIFDWTSQTIVADYVHYGPPNTLHIGWMMLMEQYGWEKETNELKVLSQQKGTPVYLKDMLVVVPAGQVDQMNPSSLYQWGASPLSGWTPERRGQLSFLTTAISHSPIVEQPGATEDHLLVRYVWEEIGDIPQPEGDPTQGTIVKEDMLILIPSGYDDAADYFHVKYTVDGVVHFWMYKVGTGTYPQLDELYDDPVEEIGTFFPVTYFRFAKTPVGTDKNSEDYKSSKKLMKYLGMDFETVRDAIHDNPDIEDVEQAMMMMAVPPISTNPIEQRYLYDFFNNMYYEQDTQFSSITQSDIQQALLRDVDIPKNTIIIQDKLFKMALSNSGIFKKRIFKRIGKVGHTISGYTTESVSMDYQTYAEGDNSGDGQIVTKVFDIPCYVYERQISDVLVDQVKVMDLRMVYYVFGEYTTTGDEVDQILLVPLDRSITNDYSMADREELYSRSLHYIFNSRVITKLAWYQQEWFQFFIIIVAIVITILTYGAAWEAFAAGIAAGTIAVETIIMTLAMGILKFVATGLAIKLFVKEVGGEFALIVAVIAVAYGMYEGYVAGGLSNSPWAQQLLSVGNNLVNGISESYQTALQGLQQDFLALDAMSTAADSELERANTLLDQQTILSPFILFGEKPDDFYNRTVHSGNIGVLAVEATHTFYDRALTLPTLSETLGDE